MASTFLLSRTPPPLRGSNRADFIGMFVRSWPRLNPVVDRFVRNFVNLGNLYSMPYHRPCFAFLDDGTNVIWEIELSHEALEREVRVLRDFKADLMRTFLISQQSGGGGGPWGAKETQADAQVDTIWVKKSFSPVGTLPYSALYEHDTDLIGLGAPNTCGTLRSIIVHVNSGHAQKRYHVFAKQNDICRGYLSCAGPFTTSQEGTREDIADLVPTWQNPHGKSATHLRRLAQQNRKGCLIRGHLIWNHTPETDLFLQVVAEKSTVEKIEKYVDSARMGPRPTDRLQRANFSVRMSLNQNLEEYCRKISKTYENSQAEMVATIWRTTANRTDNPWVVHRTWRARALLFKQLEDGEKGLTVTREIMGLLVGRPTKQARLRGETDDAFGDFPMDFESPSSKATTGESPQLPRPTNIRFIADSDANEAVSEAAPQSGGQPVESQQRQKLIVKKYEAFGPRKIQSFSIRKFKSILNAPSVKKYEAFGP